MKALVLSGGGARGAFQVGVLKRWIEEHPELDYDIYGGTSAGAINASVLASLRTQMPFKDAVLELEKFWKKDVRKNGDVYRMWPVVIPMFWKDSIYDTGPLSRLLKEKLAGKPSAPCYVAATNIVTSELVYFSETHPDFWRCVLASASFPVFFPTVEIDGSDYSDGASIHNIPIGQMIRKGATDIHMVCASNPYGKRAWKKKKNVFTLLAHTIDIMTAQMSKSDLEITGFRNDIADVSPLWNKVTLQTVFFEGSGKYDVLSFRGDNIDKMIELGYEQALKAVIVD